jgi:dihydrofolate reductase
MNKLRFHIAVSLDGYVAGPNQSEENPIGEDGEQLHEWMLPLAAFRESHGEQGGEVNASTQIVEEMFDGVGAAIMGRNMFGPVRGRWENDSWKGWWGDDPPFHMPVYVLTHQEREPVEMQGGTTFHFVTEGIESALEQAANAAGDEDVTITGGASVIRQYLAAGLVDEMNISVAPVLLGGGEPLFDETTSSLKLEQLRAVEAPGVAHLQYRVVK